MLLIILMILIIILCVWIYTSTIKQESVFSTIHSRCNSHSPCDGELVCDNLTGRCKKPLSGICATDVDCKTGLFCVGWKCSELDKKSTFKRVRWDDSKNLIHLF